MSTCNFKQLGFAKQEPSDVALATFKYLYLNPDYPRYQTIALCQYDSTKLAVMDQQCSWLGSAKLMWVARPRAEVLDEVLDNIADVLDNIVKKVPHKLPKRHIEGLQYFSEHVVKPVALSEHPNYEQMYREGHPLEEAREKIYTLI